MEADGSDGENEDDQANGTFRTWCTGGGFGGDGRTGSGPSWCTRRATRAVIRGPRGTSHTQARDDSALTVALLSVVLSCTGR